MGRTALFLLLNFAFLVWFIRRISLRTVFHFRREAPLSFYSRIQELLVARWDDEHLEERIRTELRIGLAERNIEPKDFDIVVTHDEVTGPTASVVHVESGRAWSLSGFDVFLREQAEKQDSIVKR